MSLQTMALNMRRQVVETTGQRYWNVWRTWRDTQREAFAIVARNGRSVANTEIGAAKNIVTSARAALDRARKDGWAEVAREPMNYVPAGRKQVRSAYRTTLDLFGKTRSELTEVAGDGYRQLRSAWSGQTVETPVSGGAAAETTAAAGRDADAQPAKARKTARKQTTARRTGGADQTARSDTGASKSRKAAPRKKPARRKSAASSTSSASDQGAAGRGPKSE